MKSLFTLPVTLGLVLCAPLASADGSPSPAEMNRMIIGLILGNKHQVDFSGPEPKIDPVFSAANLSSLDRQLETMANKWLTEKAGLKLSADPYNSSGFTELTEQICMVEQELMNGQPRPEAEKLCRGRASDHYPKKLNELHKSVATRMFYFKVLMDYENDREYAKKACQMLAFRLGWEVKTFHVDHALSFVLVPTEMKDWSPRVLKAALHFAEGHEKIIAEVKKALKVANPYECIWYPGGIFRDRQGDGWGKAYYNPDAIVRPDVGGSGGKVACKDVPSKKTDKAFLAAVRKALKKPQGILAVTPIVGQDWVENKNRYDELVSKSIVVHIYERVLR